MLDITTQIIAFERVDDSASSFLPNSSNAEGGVSRSSSSGSDAAIKLNDLDPTSLDNINLQDFRCFGSLN